MPPPPPPPRPWAAPWPPGGAGGGALLAGRWRLLRARVPAPTPRPGRRRWPWTRPFQPRAGDSVRSQPSHPPKLLARGPTPAPRAAPQTGAGCSLTLLARGPTPAPRARATNRRGVFSNFTGAGPHPRASGRATNRRGCLYLLARGPTPAPRAAPHTARVHFALSVASSLSPCPFFSVPSSSSPWAQLLTFSHLPLFADASTASVT